jgi:hypothetical protein
MGQRNIGWCIRSIITCEEVRHTVDRDVEDGERAAVESRAGIDHLGVFSAPPQAASQIFDAVVVAHLDHGVGEGRVENELCRRCTRTPGQEVLPSREGGGAARPERVQATPLHDLHDALGLVALDLGQPSDGMADLADLDLAEGQRDLGEGVRSQRPRDGAVGLHGELASAQARAAHAHGLRRDLEHPERLHAVHLDRCRFGSWLDAAHAVTHEVDFQTGISRRGRFEGDSTAERALDSGRRVERANVRRQGGELEVGRSHGDANGAAPVAAAFPLHAAAVALRVDEVALDSQMARVGNSAAVQLSSDGFEREEQRRRQGALGAGVHKYDGGVAQLYEVRDAVFLENGPRHVFEVDQRGQNFLTLGRRRAPLPLSSRRQRGEGCRTPAPRRVALDSQAGSVEENPAELRLAEDQRQEPDARANAVDLELRHSFAVAPDAHVGSLQVESEAGGETDVADRDRGADELRQAFLGLEAQRFGSNPRRLGVADDHGAGEDRQSDEDSSVCPRHGPPLGRLKPSRVIGSRLRRK